MTFHTLLHMCICSYLTERNSPAYKNTSHPFPDEGQTKAFYQTKALYRCVHCQVQDLSVMPISALVMSSNIRRAFHCWVFKMIGVSKPGQIDRLPKTPLESRGLLSRVSQSCDQLFTGGDSHPHNFFSRSLTVFYGFCDKKK